MQVTHTEPKEGVEPSTPALKGRCSTLSYLGKTFHFRVGFEVRLCDHSRRLSYSIGGKGGILTPNLRAQGPALS